ncbi:MAG: TIGR00282 family metallophosphoesterase [Nitrospiraceae bacterium]|nr:MAG: TIGR00282 family metallophosphoesterase [Nitrospiraceae bacterium]
MKVLFIGDIVGESGRKALRRGLSNITERLKIDFVIANVENAAGGFGITKDIGEEILSLGVDVLTSGNHIWDKKEAVSYIAEEQRLLRPANYPEDVPGQGSIIIKTHNGEKIAVLNITGRVFMNQADNPFRVSKREILKLKKHTNIIIVDFHAEATSEKSAFGWFLDGEATAVIGTHTHVQTADETILPKGTAFITDVGMTGPINSVIGIKKEIILRKFLTYMPARFETAKGKSLLSAVVIDIDTKSGNAKNIERLQLKFS